MVYSVRVQVEVPEVLGSSLKAGKSCHSAIGVSCSDPGGHCSPSLLLVDCWLLFLMNVFLSQKMHSSTAFVLKGKVICYLEIADGKHA